MPTLPKRAWCPQCQQAHEGKCEKYKRATDERLSASQRGYDVAWRRVRAVKLIDTPWCEDCYPRIEGATEVHHVRKVSEYPSLRLEMTNLMSLCRRCHNIRTARGE